MANYTKTTDFAAKDTLPGGDSNKVVRGSEFETEFDAISTAISTKADTASPTFTGTATFATLNATTIDLNGGALDNVVIGANTAAAGSFTDLTANGTINFNGATISNLGTITTANIDGGTADNVVIGGSTPAAGTFTSVVATTADINGGTIDDAVIGGTTPAAGTFAAVAGTTGTFSAGVSGTTGTFSGNVSGVDGTFSGNVTGANLAISNWNTAYGWGDHSTAGYLTTVTFSNLDSGAVTTSSETFASSDTQIPTNKAVIDYVAGAIPGLSVTEASVVAHQAALAIAATQLTGNITVPGNVYLAPSGTGFTELRGNQNAGAIRFNCEANSHGVTLKGPSHSANATYTLELPNADGVANQVLTTDGNGKLSFADAAVSFAESKAYFFSGF
tara:strand:+ start:477 stop:1646 length:1170 start_codon:yes stop_codon:yes gene_type:complete